MKSNNRELVKKTLIITIGNMSTKLISFLLLPFYTYILSMEEFGTYDVLHTYIYLLVPLLGMQLDQAAFKFLVEARCQVDNQKKLITSTTVFMVLQVIAYALIFIIIREIWDFKYLPYLAGLMISTVILYDTQQMVRGINKTGLYAAAGAISSGLGIVCNVLFLTKFDMRVDGLFMAGIVSSGVAILFLWCTSGLHKYINLKVFSMKTLKQEMAFSVPLVPNELAWWVIHASDRTIVSLILGVAQNGIIAVSQKFSAVYITVYNIFNLSWTESVILHFRDADGEEYISDTINTVTTFFFSVAIGIIAVIPFVFSMFINTSYSKAYYLIPIYMLAGVVDIYLGMISAVFVAESKTKYIAFTTILAGVINIVIHLILISFIGVMAAPISTIIAYGTILIIRYTRLRTETKIRFSKDKIFGLLLLLILSLGCYYSKSKIACAICLLFDFVICIRINRSMLDGIKQIVLKKIRK